MKTLKLVKRGIFSLLLILNLSLHSKAGLLSEISQVYSHIESAQGKFMQTALFSDGRRVVYRGIFYAQRLRSCWVYKEPERQVVLVIGQRIFIYNPQDDEIQEGSLELRLFSNTSLINVDRMKRDFIIIEEKDRVIAYPRADVNIERIELTFQNLHLKKIVVMDKMGNVSIIQLEDVKYNVQISPEIFSLDYWRRRWN